MKALKVQLSIREKLLNRLSKQLVEAYGQLYKLGLADFHKKSKYRWICTDDGYTLKIRVCLNSRNIFKRRMVLYDIEKLSTGDDTKAKEVLEEVLFFLDSNLNKVFSENERINSTIKEIEEKVSILKSLRQELA